LEIVLDVYQSSASGGRTLALEGEAGIGKTRLISELADHALRSGGRVIRTQCYEGEDTLAFAPVVAALRTIIQQAEPPHLEHVPDHWLSEAARLLPELALLRPGLPSASPLDSLGGQSRFFEGLRQILLVASRSDLQPGMLIVDDLQWADSATLDLLAYLSRRASSDALCMVLAWRDGEVATRHRLQQLLTEVRRDGRATHLTLGRLSPAAVGEWIASVLGSTEQGEMPHVASRLYEETEGLPFFISEYVHALSSGALLPRERDWAVPGGVHDLLRSRLHGVSEAGWQVLTTAAVLGRSFDFVTVREASGRSEEETIVALEELMAHSLISELRATDGTGPSYDFTHEKLRTLVYDECSLARRRLLHRRVAEVLSIAAKRQRPGAPPAGQIAQHYLAAGDEATAAEYYGLAGERALVLYANAEAVRDFQQALALGHPNATGLHEAIGDAQMLLGEYAAARMSYEVAAAGAPAASLARLERKLSKAYARRGEWEAARSQLEAALAALGEGGEEGERARLYADWSLIARHQGQCDEAQRHAEQALQLAMLTGDERALAQVHNILGLLANDRGERHLARQSLERSLELAERLDDASARVAALNNLALALGAGGGIDRAVTLAEAALALCATMGERHHEAALHNNLADLLYAGGRGEEAMAHLKQAVRIYAEIGVEAGTVQPAIWKLTEW
jgi:predicted ATPase